MDSAVGTVDIASTDVATTTIQETGLGFTPKVVLLWWSGRSESTDTIGKANAHRGFGFVTGTASRGYLANRHDDNQATTAGGRRLAADGCIGICTTAGAEDGRADLSSFDADGFTLIVDVQFSVDLRVHYMALGGPDVVNATTGFFSESNQTASTTSVTGVGFQPNTVLLIGDHAGDVTLPHSATEARFVLGVAAGTATAAQGVYSSRHLNAAASQTVYDYVQQGQIHALARASQVAGDAAHVSSFDADGFTLTWGGGPTPNADQSAIYLALDLTNAAVGLASTRTDGADITVSGLGFQPAAIMFMSHGAPESTLNTEDQTGKMSLGFAKDEATRGAQMVFAEPGTDPSEVSTAIEHDAVYVNPDAAHAVDGLMDVKSVDAGGFTAVMDDPETSVADVLWLAVGPAEAVGGGLTESRVKTTVQNDIA